jgi:cellulose synthase/poly-beta-1,6-N-acetylglucosamine synthase-like glycosyltransferase/peptidoglycan/xylan/chitin deacetylase (PgdA/CDA1 family)
VSSPAPRRRSSEHWWTLGAALVVIAVMLCLQGFARSEIGHASSTSNDTSASVPHMETVGPIIDLSGGEIRSLSPPAGTIALTFDDGPNTRWTPQILDVLRRFGVPATFFVIGSHAVDHAGMLRRELASGDEIGNHTFTHVDLSGVATWRLRMELRLTEAAIASATGRHTILVRPPYSSTPDAAATRTLQSWQRVAHQGYVIVVATRDAEDWRPDATVDDIVRRAMPAEGSGAVILMHDGGGDRSRTVEALERLIPALQARGDRFVTIGDMAHLPRSSVMPAAGLGERLQSRIVTGAFSISHRMAELLAFLAVLVSILTLARLVLVVICVPHHRKRLAPLDSAYRPRVTVLVPAYNEELGIRAALRSLCDQHYDDFEVIVVDDGSTDNTAACVEQLMADDRSAPIRLVRQANAGKANALNAGLALADGEIIVSVDADTVFAPVALAALVRPLEDPSVGAVSGNTKVGNTKRLLGRWQRLEYVMGFNLDRRMYDVLGCMPTVPGAIGAFRASALAAVDGFSDDTLAEDTDLTMALHRAGYRVVFEPRAIALTEAPQNLGDLWRQRYRWSYGTIQSVWKHRRALVARGPGSRLGRVGLPYLIVFQIMLPLLGPVFDLFTIYGLLFLDRTLIAEFWLAFTTIQMATCIYALRLDREPVGDVWTLPLQQFVYRQVMYLVVIQAMDTALTGARTGWHKLRRHGALASPS